MGVHSTRCGARAPARRALRLLAPADGGAGRRRIAEPRQQSVSHGTGEQATSVQTTTASIQQVSASIALYAEASRRTEVMAKDGSRSAQEGGGAVSEAVAAMRTIVEKTSIVEEIA